MSYHSFIFRNFDDTNKSNQTVVYDTSEVIELLFDELSASAPDDNDSSEDDTDSDFDLSGPQAELSNKDGNNSSCESTYDSCESGGNSDDSLSSTVSSPGG